MIKTNVIYNGDCLEVMKDIPDKSIDMILCDLPYGTTKCSWDVVIPFEPLWEQYKRIVKDNACICLFGSQPFTTDLINSNRKMFKYELIWEKNFSGSFALANKRIMKYHENISVFYNKQCIYNPIKTKGAESTIKRFNKILRVKRIKNYNNIQKGLKIKDKEINPFKINPKSVLKFDGIVNANGNRLHPTQKPVELLSYLIKTYTNENDLVLDNCIGSGSTAVSCIKTGRNYIGIEKEKKYYDICLKRIREAEESVSLLNIIKE